MSKENNDALEQGKENAQVIENDEDLKDQELKSEKSDIEESKDTESKDEISKQTESTKDGESDTEKPSGSPKFLIAEIVIAVVAIGFIIFALVINNKGNNSVSGNNASG